MRERVLLTPEQMKIIYSSHKHLIIKGSFGSGKSVVGHIKAEMLYGQLKQDETLYYIWYDSRSEQVEEMRTVSKIKFFCNIYRLKLTDIMNEILKSNQTKQKINLIVDGYDINYLDEKEVEKINEALTKNEKFKDSTIFLIIQPLEYERIKNSIREKKDITSLLKSMKLKNLTCNMRNSIEISSLVKATIDILKDQTSTMKLFLRQHMDRVELEGIRKIAKFSTKNQSYCSETPVSREEIIKNQKEVHDAEKNWPHESYNNAKIPKLDLAIEYAISSSDISSISSIATNKFRYLEPKKSGHNIHSEIPNLYEICYTKESAQFKVLLTIILRKVMSEKVHGVLDESFSSDYLSSAFHIKKHVILHFHAGNDIPEPFDTIFKLIGISEKVTNRYKEFSRKKGKKILICSYHAFRGLEHPRVTVVLDHSLYALAHFLPDCLARCTNSLHIVALKEHLRVDRTLFQMVWLWKNPIRGQPLVKQWNIEIIDFEKKFAGI